MPLFRVTAVDKAGKEHINEVYAGNICGAKQLVSIQIGDCHPGVSHRHQTTSVVFRSVIKIDTPGL